MKKEILMTVRAAGETIGSERMTEKSFTNLSGVVTLLKLDPQSVVEIHKSHGISVRYEYV